MEGTTPSSSRNDDRHPSSSHDHHQHAHPAGRRIRHLLLVALVAAAFYVALDGVSDPRSVYVCDVPEYGTGRPRECSSPDDASSCVGLTLMPSSDGAGDEDDGPAASAAASRCVMSSCGYKLLPHVEVSVAGASDPFDPRAASPRSSFLSVASVFYGLVPYLGVLYLAAFLATGDIVPLTRFVVWGMIAVLNSQVFKPMFNQERPTGSCLYFESYGMPR